MEGERSAFFLVLLGLRDKVAGSGYTSRFGLIEFGTPELFIK